MISPQYTPQKIDTGRRSAGKPKSSRRAGKSVSRSSNKLGFTQELKLSELVKCNQSQESDVVLKAEKSENKSLSDQSKQGCIEVDANDKELSKIETLKKLLTYEKGFSRPKSAVSLNGLFPGSLLDLENDKENRQI